MTTTVRIGRTELSVEVNPQTGRARGVRRDAQSVVPLHTGSAPGRTRAPSSGPAGEIPAFSPYRSKTEWRFAQHLAQLKQAGEIKDWWHEPVSLRLEEAAPGRRRKRHTPDFWVWQQDGSLKIVAVKGVHRNLRDSLTLIRWAAQRYAFAEWVVVRWIDGQWVEGLVS